jgi:hypothetical protein
MLAIVIVFKKCLYLRCCLSDSKNNIPIEIESWLCISWNISRLVNTRVIYLFQKI